MVPYAGAVSAFRSAKRARMVSPYARVAAHWAYHNSGTAARAIQRAWRKKRKSRKRKKPMKARMQPNSKAAGKQHMSNVAAGPGEFFGYGRLRATRVLDAPAGGGQVFNARDKAHVYYKGYRLCRTFENITQNADSAAIEVHYALIQWSKGAFAQFIDAANVDQNITVTDEEIRNQLRKNFFRRTDGVTTRAADFDDYGQNSIWRHDLNCLPMNPANGFNIIFHKKRVLFPRSLNNSSRRYYWKMEKYIPVKKRIQFRTPTDSSSLTPFYEIYWCNTVTPAGLPTADPGASARIRTFNTHTLYFKD